MSLTLRSCARPTEPEEQTREFELHPEGMEDYVRRAELMTLLNVRETGNLKCWTKIFNSFSAVRSRTVHRVP